MLLVCGEKSMRQHFSIFIPSRMFLVRVGGISGKTGRAKIPMAGTKEPDSPTIRYLTYTNLTKNLPAITGQWLDIAAYEGSIVWLIANLGTVKFDSAFVYRTFVGSSGKPLPDQSLSFNSLLTTR